jgi:hypothetical protein
MIQTNAVLDFVVGATWDLRFTGGAVAPVNSTVYTGAHTL